jgi:hypothetical protein
MPEKNGLLLDTAARIVDKRKNWEARVEMAIFKRPSNEMSTYDKLVYAILCGHANRDGNASVYVKTIAEEASCSERQVQRAVSIGDNVTIGAGSIVTKSIRSNVLAYGNPCRIIREI